MRIHLKIYSLMLLLAGSLCMACSDEDNNQDDPEEPGDLTPIAAPVGLSVVNVTDVTAILVWEGVASEFEVEMASEVLPTKSLSYGLKDLTPATPYAWKVRSKEGSRYSDWVTGPGFTTLKTVDETVGWPGNWEAADFKLEISSQGVSIPVDMFIPDTLLGIKVGVTIEKKEGTNNRVLFSSPVLKDILPIPLTIDMEVKNGEIVLIRTLDDTIKAPIKEPISIGDLPFISEIPAIGDLLKDAKVTELGIIMQGLNVSGKLEEEQIPVHFSISGKFRIVTDNLLINTSLNLIPLNVTLNAGMTLSPKE